MHTQSNEKFNEKMAELDKLKADAKRIEHELHLAYEYKEDVLSKVIHADRKISEKQKEYHSLLTNMRTKVCNLKIYIDTEYIQQ